MTKELLNSKIVTDSEWDEYTELKKTKNDILIEISNFCETCPSHECCPEEECILYTIEQMLNSSDKEKDTNYIQVNINL